MSIYRNPNNEVGYYLQGNTSNGVESNAEARAEVAKADWAMLQWKWSSAKSAEKLYISQIRALRPNGVKLLMYTNPRMWYNGDETNKGGTTECVWLAVSTLGAPASWRARNAAGKQMSHIWNSETNATSITSTELNSQGQTYAQALVNRIEETMALDLYDGIMIDDFSIIPDALVPKNESGSSNWSYKNDGVDYDILRDLPFGDAFRNGMISIVNEIRRRRPTFLINTNTNPAYFYRQNYTGSWRRPWSAMQYYQSNDIGCCENGLAFGAGLWWPTAAKHTYPFQSWFAIPLIFENMRFYQDVTRPATTNLAGRSLSFLHQEMNLRSTDTPLAIDYAFARACWAMTKLEEGVGYGLVRNTSRPFFLDETCLKLGNVVGGPRSMGTHDTTSAPSKFTLRAPNLQVGAAKFYWQEFDNALVVCRLDTDGLTMGTSMFGDGNAASYTLPAAGAGKKWRRVDCRTYVHPEFADLKMTGQDPAVNNGADAVTSTLKPMHGEVFLRVNSDGSAIVTQPAASTTSPPIARVENTGIMFSLDPTNPNSYPGTGAEIVDVDTITVASPAVVPPPTVVPGPAPIPGPQGPQGPIQPPFDSVGLQYPRLGTYWIGYHFFNTTDAIETLACQEVIMNEWFTSNPAVTLENIIQSVRALAPFPQYFYAYRTVNEFFRSGSASWIYSKLNAMNWWLYPGSKTTGPITEAVNANFSPNNAEVNITGYTTADARGLRAPDWLAEAYYNLHYRQAGNLTNADFNAVPDSFYYAPSLTGIFLDNCFFGPRVPGNWNVAGGEETTQDLTTAREWRKGYANAVKKLNSFGIGATVNLAEFPGITVDRFPGVQFGTFPFEQYHQIFDGGAIEYLFGYNLGFAFESQVGVEDFKKGYLTTLRSVKYPERVVAHQELNGNVDYNLGAYATALTAVFGDAAAYLNNLGGKPVWLDENSVNRATGECYTSYSAAGVRAGLRWLGRAVDPAQSDKPAWKDGVYRRRFEFGEIYVNYKGNGTRTLTLDRAMKKLKGTQRPTVNDGKTVTEITLPERSAVFLLYPNAPAISSIIDDSYYLSYDPLNTRSYAGTGTVLNDLSPTANTAALVGGVTYSAGVFTLNGTNGYIQSSKTFNDPEEFSIEVWFQTTGSTGKKIVGFENANTPSGSSNYDRHLYVGTDGKLAFGVYDGNTRIIQSTGTIAPNTWYQAVATFKANTAKLYLNGVLQSTGTSNGAENFTGYWRIGSNAMGGWDKGTSGFFSGKIGVTAIYKRELPPAEILARYTENSGRYGVAAPASTPPGPTVSLK